MTNPEATDRPVVLILNGPNLNLLGERQPLIYGSDTLDDLMAAASEAADGLGLAVEHLQSNHEGVLVDAIHGARGRCAGLVVNGGALTHYSWSLRDALATFEGPVIEVHISNPGAREDWRHVSVVAAVATGTIAGLGGFGYVLAIQAMRRLLDDRRRT